jgi:type IV secretion system protein VirD4
LQSFNKQKGEVLILHGREYPFITYMADIDQYPDFANWRVVPIAPIEIPHVPTFDVIKFTTKNAFLPDGVPFNEPD